MPFVTECDSESRAVDHEHKTARTITVVLADEVGHACMDTLERVAVLHRRQVLTLLLHVYALLVENAACREERLNGSVHLVVDRLAV